MHAMRRGTTFLLVMLLVLRGLLGDAMAMGAVPGVMAMPTSQQPPPPLTGEHDRHSRNATNTNTITITNIHDRLGQADPTGHGNHSNHAEPMGLGAHGGHDLGTPSSLASAATPADTPAAHAACPSSDANAEAAASACSHEHGPACSACGICHSALFAAGLQAPPSQPQPSALRAVGNTHFDSAAAALAIKPPIS